MGDSTTPYTVIVYNKYRGLEVLVQGTKRVGEGDGRFDGGEGDKKLESIECVKKVKENLKRTAAKSQFFQTKGCEDHMNSYHTLY